MLRSDFIQQKFTFKVRHDCDQKLRHDGNPQLSCVVGNVTINQGSFAHAYEIKTNIK